MDVNYLKEHLTKEIETLENNIMLFRSKVSFTIFVGTFILLGAMFIATKGALSFPQEVDVLLCFLFFFQ